MLFILRTIFQLINIIHASNHATDMICWNHFVNRFILCHHFIAGCNPPDQVMICSVSIVWWLFSVQTIKLISIIFQIAHSKTIDQTHCSLKKQIHRIILTCQLQYVFHFFSGFCNIPDKNHCITGTVIFFSSHKDVANPTFLTFYPYSAFKSDFFWTFTQFFNNKITVVKMRNRFLVLINNIIIQVCLNQFIPCMALFKNLQKRILYF